MTPDEQRLDSLLSAIPHGVQENDLNGVITYSNPTHHKILGYEPGELLGKTIFDLLYVAEEKNKLAEYLTYLVAEQPEPTPYITKTRRKDGDYISTQVDWAYQRDEKGNLIGFASIITDITEQLILQENLCKERDLAQHYLDVAQFMMVVLDSSGHISLVNRKACHVLGYSADQLLHQNWFELCLPEEQRKQVAQVFQSLMKGEIELAEYYENPVITATGKERLIAWHNTIQHDSDGYICGTISSGEDITEKALAKEEKTRLFEQIRKAQKMEALGRLTSGIAHDFNNILASILGYADLTLEAVTKLGEDELSRYINEVIKEGEKARDLITQMLAFARTNPSGDVVISPVPLVKELARMIQASLPENIDLVINAEADIPKVLFDPSQLHQTILNVCINALDALEQRQGNITINISHVTCHQAKCNSCHESFEGDFIEIAVADDGQGIDPISIDQMFEPFFSTKENRKNSGMGLATTHGIIHEHQGHIIVDSIVDYGTTIRLLLPAYTELETAKSASDKRGANILIVEDEETIANLQSELLQSKGFNTAVYSDAYEALATFKSTPEKFDCVVIDEAMPSLSGIEFSKQALKLRPEIPIILCSTNAQANKQETLAEPGIRSQLQKPFTSEQLIDQIHHALQSEKSTELKE